MSGSGMCVCVTGASGYTASMLVKLLLQRGYTVNATVRDPCDPMKVNHLVNLEGAKERLHLFKADLLEEGSFDDAISNCDGVFHVASPCFPGNDNPQVELLDPAIKGTINVLESCTKVVSLKRVVLTSSIGAMLINDNIINPDCQVDESWWSDPLLCLKQEMWYPASKILAEQAAWKFAKEKNIDLITICPGWTLGPLLQPTLNYSCAVIFDLIRTNSVVDAAYGWVNVKDVAIAHIQAFEIDSANGRYCLVERDVHFNDIVKMMQQIYPSQQPCDEEPATLKPLFKHKLPSCKYSRKKAESLGIKFTPFEIGLKETIESFKPI